MSELDRLGEGLLGELLVELDRAGSGQAGDRLAAKLALLMLQCCELGEGVAAVVTRLVTRVRASTALSATELRAWHTQCGLLGQAHSQVAALLAQPAPTLPAY